MQSSSDDRDPFPLSWLTQYVYCPRRCGLLALDQAWSDNEYTAQGSVQHSRVHTARIERRGDILCLFDLPVYSHRIGVTGRCDCVEALHSQDGAALPYGEGRFVLHPVEYKHGTVREEESYQIQLCAQAMCLEEQFGGHIADGELFYMDAHRRYSVEFTPALREKVLITAVMIQEMLEQQQIPEAKYGPKCKKCSMQEICCPKIKRSAAAYMKRVWNAALESELS